MDSHNRAIKVPGGVSRCQLSSCGRFYHKVNSATKLTLCSALLYAGIGANHFAENRTIFLF